MGIKHKTPKVSGEKGFAAEWNDEHLIDSDINFNSFSGINLGEPINPADIATKNYVDSISGISGAPQKNYISGGAETFNNSNWNNVTGASFPVTVVEGGFVFLFATLESHEPYNFLGGQIKFIRDGTEITGSPFKSTSDSNQPHPTTINVIDTPSPGSYVYKLQYKSDDTVNNRGTVSRWNFGYLNYAGTQGVVGEGIKRKTYENYTQIFSSAGVSEINFTIPTSGLIIGFLLKADMMEDSGYGNRGAAISLGATGTNLGTKYLTGYITGLNMRYSENYLHSFMWGDTVPGGFYNIDEGVLLYDASSSYITKQVNGFALLDMIDDTTTFTIKVYGSANGTGWMQNIRCEILYF